MSREQELGRIRGQLHHRHACPEGRDREYDFRAQPIDEVLQVGGGVPARHVNEVKPTEISRPKRPHELVALPGGGAFDLLGIAGSPLRRHSHHGPEGRPAGAASGPLLVPGQ